MTNDLLIRIGEAAIRESNARAALEVSEGKGQREQAREARRELSAATDALRALIAKAQQ